MVDVVICFTSTALKPSKKELTAGLPKLIIMGNEQLFDFNSNVHQSSSCEAPKQAVGFSNSVVGCLILEEFQLQHLTPSHKQIVPPLKRLFLYLESKGIQSAPAAPGLHPSVGANLGWQQCLLGQMSGTVSSHSKSH